MTIIRSFVDAEDVVKDWLLTTSVAPLVTVGASAKIFLAMPKGAPLPAVLLSRVGGTSMQGSDTPIDAARISFSVWAANRPQAKTIKLALLGEIESIGYQPEYVGSVGRIKAAELLTDLWLPDPETDTPRYVVDATMYVQAL